MVDGRQLTRWWTGDSLRDGGQGIAYKIVDGGSLQDGGWGNSLRGGGRGTAYKMVDGRIAYEMVNGEQLMRWWTGDSL